MVSLRLLLSAVLLVACTGCPVNHRPTVAGQVVDATTGLPLRGVLVSVYSLESTGRERSPEALGCTTSNSNGKFFCKGEDGADLWAGYVLAFQVRLYREDYLDSVYDFTYEVKHGLFPDRKQIGRIPLHPRLQAVPASQPAYKLF